jgi:calcium-binding protein CML
LKLFLCFDLDSDGSITKLKLAALLRSLGLCPTTGDKIPSSLVLLVAPWSSMRSPPPLR